MIYHLTVSDLKFVDTKQWVEVNVRENVSVGAVCCLVRDRIPEWNLFVVVDGINPDQNDDKQKYKVIFPRIRIIDGEIFLGQDKSFDSKQPETQHDKKCQLCNIQQGCCFYCTCGYDKKIAKQYGETFIPVKEGTYRVYDFDCKMYYEERIILERVQIRDINQLDIPIVWCSISPTPVLPEVPESFPIPSSNKEEVTPKYLKYDDLKKLVETKVITKSTLCKFSRLRKGCWTYILKVNGETYYICGGTADHQSAYDLELDETYPVKELAIMMMDIFSNDFSFWW